ncbi:protein lin-54 homolog [Leucoraja erinacea]|uniref:protein lin-54 homolog n=1 Tax=Leucoraja erinaceus TaxID=7782 RepID=UPI0024584AA4|nr:protein lin-54 homolog [Leucoraja erinacea]XP_055495404.1 protein lin-54 homolog [Leucoraja erinacea]XP_055495413.1 protein lin-54 homolog [Leucoraja erinacea]XP_055495422.1 protein lin-54 homolog [Leucoraja erinacea]XP_055495429.1 protein lin-54 homolog [Leucoraja erinacea]XP_055495437.1 protein lin-54 homolog [Leucoraja erinacea]XP_055495446.1 protein lin-54 homolog [Leucoraja erinacea]
MEVVSAEVVSLLPEEIMDTTVVDEDTIEAVTITSEHEELVPMETELEEIVHPDEGKHSQVLSSLADHVTVLTNSSTILSAPLIKMEVNLDSSSQPTSKINHPSTTGGSSAENQVVLKAVSGTVDHPTLSQVIKSEPIEQQFVVTTLGKSRQSIVLSLPSCQVAHLQHPSQLQVMDPQMQKQIKVVTISERFDGKTGIGASNTLGPGNSVLTASIQPAQTQMKTLQIAKKCISTSSSTPMITKVIIAKPIQKNIITGRVLSQSAIGTAPNTITISESGVTGTSLNPLTQQTATKIAISPLKSPNKTMKPAVQTLTMGTMNTTQFKTIIPLATSPNVQQIQVPGSKFHYVRLVPASTASGSSQTVSSSSSTNTQPLSQAKTVVLNPQVRMSIPIAPAQNIKNVVPKPIVGTTQMVTTSQPQQRLIMPATALPQIQPNLTNLPPGTVLAPAPGSGSMGYAVVPAQYVTQLQQASYVSISNNNGFSGTSNIQTQAKLPINGSSTSESGSRPRKPCNCTKSQCLKLYCDCFANGEFCNSCNCTNCFNNLDHEAERLKAIKACLDRNPEAFKPKIGKGKEGESDRRHSKGCNCKRSGCLKNYCECYEAKIMCSSICKCIGCKNFEESPERKTLMHLADAAEVRVQQQTAAKTKLSSQMSDLLTRTTPAVTSSGGKLPFTFVTKEVAEATCECLLAQAEEGEKNSQTKAVTEHMILEEFGRCLMQIINSAGKAKGDACTLSC